MGKIILIILSLVISGCSEGPKYSVSGPNQINVFVRMNNRTGAVSKCTAEEYNISCSAWVEGE